MIDCIRFTTPAAVGSPGAATATGYSLQVSGRVLSVHLAYHDTPPATSDVTLVDENDPAGEASLSLANANTDLRCCPRRAVQDNAGSDLTFDGTHKLCTPYVVYGRLLGSLAQANAGDSVTFTVWLDGAP